MKNSPAKIVVIHDSIDQGSPIMVTLAEKYGEENVLLFKHSQQGLSYVLENLGQKIVVLLDKNFEGKNEIPGIKVFEEIRQKTSLVYVVLVTVSKFSEFEDEELKLLINNEIFAIESFTSDYLKIVEHIDRAVAKFDSRVDCVIEQWILQHSKEELDQPYISDRNDKVYSLKDILKEIRERSNFGIDMERKIIALTIDMLARGKKKIDA